ncbi:MAG: response regulator transcription factor [Kiritimatiellae bacterium]|nr:response regulator transcription factor [Kiritimatiellia bacterium]
MQLLIIEDDAKTADFVKRGFEQAGWQCTIAPDGETGLSYASTTSFDAIVTDIMLPKMNGIALLKRLRANGCHTPAVVLSALGSVESKIAGLEAGGDDYLAKPFSIAELVARVQTVLRRAAPQAAAHVATTLKAADLEMDLVRHQVTRGERKIRLQPLEYQLLEYLLRNQGRVVTKATVMQHVWDYDAGTMTNVVEACVCRLRDKIDKDEAVKLIHTVRGFGYVLENQA